MSLRKRLDGFTPSFFSWWMRSRQLITSEARLKGRKVRRELGWVGGRRIKRERDEG
jgi:hypothetical protein